MQRLPASERSPEAIKRALSDPNMSEQIVQMIARQVGHDGGTGAPSIPLSTRTVDLDLTLYQLIPAYTSLNLGLVGFGEQ